MSYAMLAAFGLYLFILLLIAFAAWVYNKQQAASTAQEDDFILGGRSLSYWVTALSAHASDMSDWLFMGLPGAIYIGGTTKLWVPASLIFGMFLCWQFIAARLRIATEQTHSYTLAGYFQKRFNDSTGLIGIATSLVTVLFFVAYLAVGIKGIGFVFNQVFGVSYHMGALLSVFAIVVYSLLGGYLAVAWTDAFQALFLLGSLLLTACYAFSHIGETADILQGALTRNVSLAVLPHEGFKGIAALLLDPFGWGLGYFGMPHILSKFMGMKNVNEMNKAKYIGITWQILALGAAVVIACIAFAFFPQGLDRPELLFIDMVLRLFTPFFAGLIICAILAATFSTMDSQILVLAGIMTDDVYKQHIRPQATRSQAQFVYRCTIVVVALVAFLIAYDENGSSIFSLVEYAWSGLGASFGPLVLASLYAKRINKYGAAAGIMTGGVVAAIWKSFGVPLVGLTVTPIIPGFIAHLSMLFFVSWVTWE